MSTRMCCVSPSLVIFVPWVHTGCRAGCLCLVLTVCVSWVLTPAERLAEREQGRSKCGRLTYYLHTAPEAGVSLLVGSSCSSQLRLSNCGNAARFLACRKVDQNVHGCSKPYTLALHAPV